MELFSNANNLSRKGIIMTKNYELFIDNPLKKQLLNDGVAEVADDFSDEKLRLLRYELQTFVCEGQYAKGMVRILESYLSNITKAKQPAAWVSGFFGSGKSHFVKMLRYLWVDYQFKSDNATARGLVKLPSEIGDLLVELSNTGKRHGGLFAASGTLGSGAGDSVRLALLGIIYKSLGLPDTYPVARFILWLKSQDMYKEVKSYVEAKEKDFFKEARRLYVSTVLSEAILSVDSKFASNVAEAKNLLRSQYPPQVEDISNDEMLDALHEAITSDSRQFPSTLIVLDEVQQFIGEDSNRTNHVQEIVESCSSHFAGKLLFVATGQSSLTGTSQLQKLRDRFSVKVELSDSDVETVVRKIVLEKKQDKVPLIRDLLEKHAGEISRHLANTRIGPRNEDKEDFIPDYPLLPVRLRFWERSLRAADMAGTASQLRSQLRVVLEATKNIAEKPLGNIVSADFMFDQKASDMINSGFLHNEVYQLIKEQDDDTEEGKLRSRLCKLIFLINKLPRERGSDEGIRATPDTLADLLLEDLNEGSATLRKRIPEVLSGLVKSNHIMQVDSEYRIQTRESAAWNEEFQKHFSHLSNDTAEVATLRTDALREECFGVLKGIKILHGSSKQPRKIEVYFGSLPPEISGKEDIPVWIRDEWSEDEGSVLADVRAAGTDNPTVFVFLPKKSADDLKRTLVTRKAAEKTLASRSVQNTREGQEAYQAMETRKKVAEQTLCSVLGDVLTHAKVFLAGGSEIQGLILAEKVKDAAERSLSRLYPKFELADDQKWATVIDRARKGATDALELVGHTGDVEKNPVCSEILKSIGAGKTGTEIRKHFAASPYGWPRDAVDGALLVLLLNGHISAAYNGKSLKVSEVDQKNITVTEFRCEMVTVQATQKIAVRKLLQEADIKVKAGEELLVIPQLFEKIKTLVDSVSGNPPLPEKPNTSYIKDIEDTLGNTQIVKLYEQREKLSNDLNKWKQDKEKIEKRLPRWQALTGLLKYAGSLDITKEIEPQVQAIKQNRSLLDEPDPVPILCEKLTDALRAELTKTHKKCRGIYDEQMAQLTSYEVWKKLSKHQQSEILASNNIESIEDIEVGTEKALLETLNKKNIEQWQTLCDALPNRFQAAITDAAKLLEPKAKRITLPKATIKNEHEAEQWLQQARKEILDNLKDGPVIL
jgi:hypothetical protein